MSPHAGPGASAWHWKRPASIPMAPVLTPRIFVTLAPLSPATTSCLRSHCLLFLQSLQARVKFIALGLVHNGFHARPLILSPPQPQCMRLCHCSRWSPPVRWALRLWEAKSLAVVDEEGLESWCVCSRTVRLGPEDSGGSESPGVRGLGGAGDAVVFNPNFRGILSLGGH